MSADTPPASGRPSGDRPGPGSPAGTSPDASPGGRLATAGPPRATSTAEPPPSRAAALAQPLLARWWAAPPWAQALVVYLASRVFAFVLIERTSRFQEPSLWTATRDPGYLGVVDLWDGDWYRKIAENGYPSSVPLGTDGRARQNELAFYPLYPMLVRLVMSVTGMGWALTATLVATLLGAAAVVVVRSVADRVAGPTLGLWTVVLLCAFPAAPVFQLAYTESLALLLLAATLWCLQRERYLLAVPVVMLIGVSRPIAVPVGVVVGLHLLRRVFQARNTPAGPLRPRQWPAGLLLLVACAVAVAEWPLITWAQTGQASAYTDTQAAWRVGHHLTPVEPWFTMGTYIFGSVTGKIVLFATVAAFLVWLTRRSAGVIAGDLRVWCLAYVGYLFLVLDPYTSLVRYLVLLFPLGTLLLSHSPSRAYRLALTATFLGGQVLWVVWLWRFVPPTDLPP